MDVFEAKQVELPEPNYEYITTNEEAKRVVADIEKYTTIEVDTETTGLDPFTNKIVLAQIGIPNKSYVFDMRYDTEHSSVDPQTLKPILAEKNGQTRLLQNAVFDMEMIKVQWGFYVEDIYDTMLAEQILNLGIPSARADLKTLVLKYLGISMTKEPSTTFQDYGMTYKPYQLKYAANDVVVLKLISDMQKTELIKQDLVNVSRLEFEFCKSICEMELNGIMFDVERQRRILKEMVTDVEECGNKVSSILATSEAQTTLFGVSLLNIDSNTQLKSALIKYGLDLKDTAVGTLENYKGIPVIDGILEYRKLQKFISTYGENLIEQINPVTGRLHTSFRQMVSTGRMSSNKPNLQNIPNAQKYRCSFISKPGYSLITADMSGAELRILGNLSGDPIFVHSYANGIDLHTKSASEIYRVAMDEVDKKMRGASKALSFGLMYGLSKTGLARRLGIPENKAQALINTYFNIYKEVKKYLDKSAIDAVQKGYSRSISGRKRFYNIPPFDSPDYKRVVGAIKRKGMNSPIQGCVQINSYIKHLGNIEDFVGERVEIETGFGKDKALGVYSGNKDVYNLKMSNGINLGITLEHKIPVCTSTGMCDKAVEDIIIGEDLLMMPLDIERGGKATSITMYNSKTLHKQGVQYKCPEVMDSRLAFIIGCIIGDGSYSRHDRIEFVCSDYQIELFSKFNSYIEDLFYYEPKIYKTKKTNCILYNSTISSVVIRGFLKHIGLDYVIHENKSIPDYFYTETVKNKGRLLNGLFSTDGGMTKESGPNYTTVSKKLAKGIHQLLLSLGINSNLKTYKEGERLVYRLQIPKRFNGKFNKLIGFSVDKKNTDLKEEGYTQRRGDNSKVPEFIPKLIYKTLYDKGIYKTLSVNEKAHLRRFKKGNCSFDSWRKFYNYMPECYTKHQLSKFLNYDFCKVASLTYKGKEDTYDLMCDNIHYFIANGVIVHNSNADTIKESMILVVDRLEESHYDAKLLLTVHDEVVVEVRDDQKYEVTKLVEQCLIDGFGRYFSKIPMETDGLIGPTWLKGECESCNNNEMIFDDNKKLICKNCKEIQE